MKGISSLISWLLMLLQKIFGGATKKPKVVAPVASVFGNDSDEE